MQKAASANSVAKNLPYIAWLLSFGVIATAFIVWGQGQQWRLSHLSTLQLFPIFGLIAFSLMWGHYIISASRRLLKVERGPLARYYDVTGYIVLIALVLHPGLLIWQLWRNGFGLPPDSYLQHYVAPGLRWAALIGTVCFFIFIAYELRYKFSDRPWWHYMDCVVDIAVLGIFYHGLRLGTQIYSGWFHWVWVFYGISLVGALAYKYVFLYHERMEKFKTKL